MQKKFFIMVASLYLVMGFVGLGFAAKVPAPAEGGGGFTAASLDKAKQLFEQGLPLLHVIAILPIL